MTKNNIQLLFGLVKTFVSLFGMQSLAACRNEAFTQRTEYGEPQQSMVVECEYRQRRTNEAVYNWIGEVELYDTINQVYYIKAARPKIRLEACNLPAELQQDGLKVRFSGEIKAVKAEEVRVALPFVIAEITRLNK